MLDSGCSSFNSNQPKLNLASKNLIQANLSITNDGLNLSKRWVRFSWIRSTGVGYTPTSKLLKQDFPL